MTELEILGGLIKLCEPKREPGDYELDGLLHCGKCRTPKQCVIDLETGPLVVGCQCQCGEAEYEAEKQAQRERDRAMHIEQLRSDGVRDRRLSQCRFENALETQELAKCKIYVDRWSDMLRDNCGLLFWGGTGNGKTFSAACIANALIDKGVPVLMTSFPRILASGWDDQKTIADEIWEYDLLVIDDLGAERESGYALETVYRVVDERYKSKKPMIITTNLTLDDLCKPQDMDHQRIYDRVLEMCVPVVFKGDSIRRKRANDNLRKAREIFG